MLCHRTLPEYFNLDFDVMLFHRTPSEYFNLKLNTFIRGVLNSRNSRLVLVENNSESLGGILFVCIL